MCFNVYLTNCYVHTGKVHMNAYASLKPSLDDDRAPGTIASPLLAHSRSIHDNSGMLQDDGIGGADEEYVVSLMQVSADKSDMYRHISVDSRHGAMCHHDISSNDAEEEFKTPWGAFFRTPAALTLLFVGWTNVSAVLHTILFISYLFCGVQKACG